MVKGILALAILLSLLLTACSADQYSQGKIRYNDQWVTREEYDRLKAQESATPLPPVSTIPPPSTIPAPPPMTSIPPTFQPYTFTGADSQTTAPFTVSTREWIIDWSYQPADPSFINVFSFFVFRRGETTGYVETVLFPQSTSGTTYSYAGPGDYYLQITANTRNWIITIRPAP
jgi:hypothetical protein